MTPRGLERAVNLDESSLSTRLVVPACCLVVALLCSAHLDQMFLDGHLGYAGALRGVIGANYLRHDPLETHFAPLQNGGPSYNDPPAVRFNHPPLSGMLVGLSFSIAGPSEAAARLVPILASVLTVPLLFGWVRRFWGIPTAIAAAAIWSFSPFVVIYGAMVSYEPLLLLAWNLLLWAWARWRLGERPQRALAWAAVAIFLGIWTDWPMAPLAGGIILTEGLLLARRRPRRPAMFLVASASFLVAFGALAFYYFVLLDIDPERLESLYRMRSSLGRWAATDVAVHIADRTALLLTWPLVVFAGLGLGFLVVGRPRSRADVLGARRTFLFVGLLAPPLALLIVLSQHAVIHCFSAWYLLPAAVVAAAVALVGLAKTLEERFGRIAAALSLVVFTCFFLWSAVPVVLDGWVSDGSPLEGRPRLRYRHLAIAGWAGEVTSPGDLLVIDEATGITGVRSWFQHDRPVRQVRRAGSIARVLRAARGKLALLPSRQLRDVDLRALTTDHGLTFIDGTLAIDPRNPGEIAVLEIREERPSWWWLLTRSACYPPYRFTPALARAALYRQQFLDEGPPTLPTLELADSSMAELAARRLIVENVGERALLDRTLEERLTFSAPALGQRLSPGLAWLGGQVETTAQGLPLLRLVFRTEADLERLPTIRATLEPTTEGRGHQWVVEPDDRFAWGPDSWIIATRRLPASLSAGPHRLEVRVGRRRPAVDLELSSNPTLPIMEPAGRL